MRHEQCGVDCRAEIIKAQSYALEMFDAEIKEEEALRERNRLKEIAGEWEEDMI